MRRADAVPQRIGQTLVATLLAGVAILLQAGPAAAIERHALLIGISSYKYVRPLEGPRYDARALREALIEEWGFDAANIEMLLDDAATRRNIEAGLARLVERTRPGDHVLIFFSGHGTSRLDVGSPWPLPDSTGALIPADFNVDGTLEEQTRRLIVGRRDLRPVLETLDRSGRLVFVIVDSCFSGNAVRSVLAVAPMPLRYVPLSDRALTMAPAFPVPEPAEEAQPAGAYPYHSVTFLAASGEHEAATDIGSDLIDRFPTSDGLPHGALTDAVLRILQGRVRADTNTDGKITYEELFRGVRQFMDERGYPQSPRLLPDSGGDRETLAERPVFELANAPVVADWTPDSVRLRVQLASGLPAAVPKALAQMAGIEVVSQAPDVLIQRDAGGLLLAAPGGDVIDRLNGTSAEALAQRLERETWVRRLLRAQEGKDGFNVLVDLRVPQRRTLVVEGEPIAFTVETEQPAYLVMLGIDPAATVSVLYPYDPDALPAPVRPDTPLLVPTGERSSELRVTFPFGVEHIVIAAIKSRPAGLMRLAGRQIGPHSPLRPDLERIFAAAEKDGAKASLRFTTVGRLPSRHER